MHNIETGDEDYFFAANKKDYDTVSSTTLCNDDGFDTGKPFPWRPSIHMPKEVARIFLRVTDVRVERLQDIDNDGAKAEGANFCNGENVGFEEKMRRSAVERFAKIWNSMIHKKDLDKYGWDANPWVWVYQFERVEVD